LTEILRDDLVFYLSGGIGLDVDPSYAGVAAMAKEINTTGN